MFAHKHGNFLPGTLIPICHPEKMKATGPDYVFYLPWNLKSEIMAQQEFISDLGGQFVVPIPELRVYEGRENWFIRQEYFYDFNHCT